MKPDRVLALSLFPEGVAPPTRWLMLALPLLVSVFMIALFEETVLLYLLLGAVGAVILGWFLYLFADRSVTNALFIILLGTIAIQQIYLDLPFGRTRVTGFVLFLYILKSLLRGELKWNRATLNGAILLLFLVFFASTLVAVDVGFSFFRLSLYLYNSIIYYFVVIHILRERDFAVKALEAYAVVAFLSALYAVWQFSGFFGRAAANVVSEATFGLPRARGLYVDANWLGAYLASAFPLAAGFFLGSKGKKEKAFWLVVVLVILGGVLFTVSRSAMFGLGSAILVLCIYSKTLRRGYLKAAAHSLYILAPLGLLFAREFYLFYVGMRNLFLKSLTVYAHLSTEMHLWLYKAALKMFLHNPVLGVGLGNFYNNLQQYMEPHPAVNSMYWWASTRGIRVMVHSSWLDILSETGLLGLIAYLLVLAIVFRYFHLANRKFLTSDPRLFYLSTALMGGMISICFSGLFYSYAMTSMHWFFVACSFVMFSLASKEEKK